MRGTQDLEMGMSEAAIKLETIFNEYLEQDEKILWKGRPVGDDVPTKSPIWFRLVFLGAGFFFSVLGYLWFRQSNTGPAAITGFLGALFLVGSVSMFLSKGSVRHTYYAVTNNRIIVYWESSKTLLSYPVNALGKIEVERKKNGTGWIYFEPKRYAEGKGAYQEINMDSLGNDQGPPSEWFPNFENIANVEMVHMTIQEAQKFAER